MPTEEPAKELAKEPKRIKIEVIKQKFFQSEFKSLQRILTYGVIVIFVFLIGSIALSDYYLLRRISELESRLPSTEPLEKLHEKSKSPEIVLPKTLYNLSGPIKTIGEDTITIEASIFEKGEDGQLVQKKEMRRALVDSKTKITSLSFVVDQETGKSVPRETTISFSNLRVGDYIEVVSNKDISDKLEFTAVQVRILPKAS